MQTYFQRFQRRESGTPPAFKHFHNESNYLFIEFPVGFRVFLRFHKLADQLVCIRVKDEVFFLSEVDKSGNLAILRKLKMISKHNDNDTIENCGSCLVDKMQARPNVKKILFLK